MRTVVEPLPHDRAVITALETVAAVGFGEAPEGALAALRDTANPGDDYLILYPLNTVHDGTLDDPHTDAELVYQVTVVGRAAAGVRYLVGQIESALLTVTVAGRAVRVVPDDLEGVRADRDVIPAVFYATPRYRLYTVPSEE